MNPSIRLRKAIPLCLVAVACFAVSPAPKAFGVSPPPDGGYRDENTAEGDDALLSLAGGHHNTAIGFEALFDNTTGGFNTANGALALASNIRGFYNTAIGANALFKNASDVNTATGASALYHNESGFNNTANGAFALFRNTHGSGNTAIGVEVLVKNRIGFENTAIGDHALENNINGTFNVAVGAFAGSNLGTVHGHGDNNIYIGSRGAGDESNAIRIGSPGTHMATFIAGISGVTVAGGVGVVIDSNGQLGTVTSSERFKAEIKPMDKASEAIFDLKPVTFRYKHELDPDGIPQFGLVAEQVAKVNPNLVARDAEGKIYTVRYDAVNAMLLNEFLKEHRTVQELKSTVAKQEATIAQQQKEFASKFALQQKEIEALTAGLQKVSTQVEMSKPAPQMVFNNQ
jgi:Chaperone of endosialidase